MPNQVVFLEKLYDLHNLFKVPTNAKTHSSTLSHEHVKLGTKEYLKYVNLSTCSTPQE